MKAAFLLLFVFFLAQSTAQTYEPGHSYFGANGYVEYLAGNLPLIISAPHGGLLSPASIPDRDCAACTTVNDFNTQELARAIAMAVHERTGCWPHVIFNKLHRRKFDANRDLAEAANGNPAVEVAWGEFHAFIETAKNQVIPGFGKGFYIDLHGHGHAIQRLEMGYLLYQSELQLPDATLDVAPYPAHGSIRRLAANNALGLSHSQLLRGALSLGSLLAGRGYPATPSESDPFPDDGEDYFNGGYNTARHSSYPGGPIDGLQIECNRQGVRDSMHNVLRFADSVAVSLLQYLGLHYFGDAAVGLCAADSAVQVLPAADLFEIFPNPYCTHFFVKIADSAPAGLWVCEVYDFYGNLLSASVLEQGQPFDFETKNKQNKLVVLRRNGQVAAMQAVLRFCR